MIGDVIAAIDLGTSRSAYAYTVTGRDEIILGVPGRLNESKVSVERKTATAILLKRAPKKSGGWCMVTFGDGAEQEYLEARTKGGEAESDLALFKYFKMELFKGGRKGTKRSSVDDAEGISEDQKTRLPLIYVVSLALEYIKDVVINRLNKADSHTLKAFDIRWVLTVPAIWSSFGTTFMRTAALRAGLIQRENDMEHLRLCLEPEAACLTVEHHHRNVHKWENGMKVMVLDCGGGTIDITTHHVVSTNPLGLEELEEPAGGPWGSTTADAKFKLFIKELLRCTDEQWARLDKSTEMFELMADWEAKKTDHYPGKNVWISIAGMLDLVGMSVKDCEASRKQFNETSTVRLKTGSRASAKAEGMGRRVSLTPELVSNFFKEAMVEIIKATQTVLARQPEISVVYMVGGFSASPLLQEHVTAAVQQPGLRVEVVERPGLAIVLGAARYGTSDSTIVSRKARLTYGTKTMTDYDEHNPEHTKRMKHARYIGGALYLDTFNCYVEKGIDLPVGTDKEETFYPLTNEQTAVSFDVCISLKPKAGIKYLKDNGVDKQLSLLKTVSAPMDMSVPMGKRGVSMQLSFGGTELGIKCTRCSDGHEVITSTVFVQDIEDTRFEPRC
ncbi:unnamed protein product [Ectocarpus sp. 6 AP-2014]